MSQGKTLDLTTPEFCERRGLALSVSTLMNLILNGDI